MTFNEYLLACYISTLTFSIPVSIYIVFDAIKRRKNWIFWFVETIIIWPLVLPFYFASRNLKINETRTGGPIWSIIKYFLIIYTLWSFIMFLVLISLPQVLNIENQTNKNLNGKILDLFFIAFGWFIPSIILLLLGLLTRNKSVIVKGPTGKLKDEYQKKATKEFGPTDEKYKNKSEDELKDLLAEYRRISKD